MPSDIEPTHALFAGLERKKRCLQGVAMMLVDDSRAVSEAIRLMAVKSGARIRRADCLASAKRHLNLFRPDVIIIDLALPDGTGLDLVDAVRDLVDPEPAILIISGADPQSVEQAARKVSANGFLTKPIANLRQFQEAVLAVLPEQDGVEPDKNAGYRPDVSHSDALLQDLENMQDLLKEGLENGDRADLSFGAQFLAGVGATAGDTELAHAADQLIDALACSQPFEDLAQATLRLIDDRVSEAWARAS